eukprot:g10908.t1
MSATAEEAKRAEGADFLPNNTKAAAVGQPATAGVVDDIESGNKGGSAFAGYDDGSSDRGTLSVLTFLKICTALSGLYMMTNPWFFFYDADKGEICPYTVICATAPVELALLTASRLSAGILYASLTFSILSKCYATRSYLHHSWLGAVLDLEPSHDVHMYFGYLTLAAGFEHGILHCIRFTVANQAWIIYETDTGRSGMVACLLLLPIVLPMKFDFFKKKMTFQTRKNMHMLFLALLVALCFHSVHFRFVGSALLVWYVLDRFYFTTKQTFLIDRPVFEAVGRGTMVGLDLPEGYTFKAGSYIYVNSPAISRAEWHPFSIIQVPGKTPKAAFYAEAVGDWTQELFRLGLGQPRLPLWITAAQPSLMERSIYYDNLVLMCTGAGITPAVSIIERFANRKNIHLMWITRDSGMVALFEKQLRKVNSTVHVTGKQTQDVKDALGRLLEPPREEMSVSGRSFTLSILNNDSFFSIGRPGRTPRSSKSRSAADEPQPVLSSAFDTNNTTSSSQPHVVFADDRPHRAPMGTSPRPPLAPAPRAEGQHGTKNDLTIMPIPEGMRATRHERASSAMSTSAKSHIVRPVDPVKVVFGRPDIGKYLTETFAMVSAASKSGGDMDVDATSRSIARKRDHSLDPSQKKSKAVLMRADSKLHLKNPSAKNKKHQQGEAGEPVDGTSYNPWLVLYCGANPKVEEAIASTCDEQRVQWKKEYFGAW